jgi:hypothetical protein
VAADFDEDGNLDLVFADCESGDLHVLIGDGHGRLYTPYEVHVGGSACAVASADLDGDGLPDLAAPTVASGTGTVSVWVDDGHGVFSPVQDVAIGGHPGAIVAADLDRDGHPDLAVVDPAGATLTTLLWRRDRCD